MEIEQAILKRKEIQSHLLDYIRNDDDKNNFEIFKDLINNISKNENNFRELLYLISAILTNHYRGDNFFSKIYKILDFLLDLPDIQANIPKGMIFMNKMIILYFLKKGIPLSKLESKQNKFNILSEDIDTMHMQFVFDSHKNCLNPYNIMYLYYYYVNNKNKEKQDQIANEIIPQKFNMDLNTFQQLCEKGENEYDLCILIRQDNLNEFIHYANTNDIDLNSKAPSSTFEIQSTKYKYRNEAIKIKDSTLIEYAAYHGSIQVFKYLFLNGAKLSSRILKYAVHGCNSEIIHIIEENSIVDEALMKDSLIEAIMCHHNDIARYFESCCGDLSNDFKKKIFQTARDYNNYEFMTTDIDELLTDNYYSFFNGNKVGSELSKITIPSSISEIRNSWFEYHKNLKEVVIPSSVIKIGNKAFSVCELLTHIIIPSSVKSIGKKAFYACSSLKNISIPSSVEIIEDGLFKKCTSLTSITIPSSVIKIGQSSFYKCTSLASIEIPSSVTSIGKKAFYACSSLKNISIPSSVVMIEDCLFKKCTSLASITIPSSVIEIGNNSFEECSSLTNVVIPSSVKSIGQYSFNKCTSLISIEISSSVKSIGGYSFRKCSSLASIKIPSFIESIGHSTFRGCTSLKSISIPSSVKSLGSYSFENCVSLTQIDIPSSVRSIDSFAFNNCVSIAQITIHSSVESIGSFSFGNCVSLTQITIPSSLTSLSDYLFSGCSSLAQITIPSSVTKIGQGTFDGCSSLIQLDIPSSVTSIDDYSFRNCTSLKQLAIPTSVTSIGNYSFSGCSSLTHVDIPSSVTSIGYFAFKGCNSLPQKELSNQSVKRTKYQELYYNLLNYLESSDDIDDHLMQLLQKEIDDNNINYLLTIISKISTSYLRTSQSFIEKIERILDLFKEQIKKNIKPNKIYQLFTNDNQIILYFIKNGILKLDLQFIKMIKDSKSDTLLYLAPELIRMESESKMKDILIQNLPIDFERKREIGQNDSEIYQIIRNDSIDEFIQYINEDEKRIHYLFETKIIGFCPNINCIYETNPLLMSRKSSYLMHYAAYFGAHKIFNYLFEKYEEEDNDGKFDVELNYIYKFIKLTCKYSIYGNHMDILNSILADQVVDSKSFRRFLIEKLFKASIMCHNNEIAKYLINNYEIKLDYSIIRQSYNFAFIDDLNAKENVEEQQNDEDENELYVAVSKGDIELVKKLLSSPNIDVNKEGKNNPNIGEEYFNSPSSLFLAVINQDVEIVHLLLQHPSIDVNKKFHTGYKGSTYRTVLHTAIEFNNIPIVKLLLNHPNIDVNAKAYYDCETEVFKSWTNEFYHLIFFSPLHEAIELGNVEIVKMLLAHPNISVNDLEYYCIFHKNRLTKKNYERVAQTALCRAVQKNNYEIVKLLLESPGIDVDKGALYTYDCDDFRAKEEVYDENNFKIYNISDDIDINNDQSDERTVDDDNYVLAKIWRYIDYSDDAVDNGLKRYNRIALQFAIANGSKDIIKLLSNKSGIKQVKVDKNNQIIKNFTKSINESFSDIKFIDKLLKDLRVYSRIHVM